MILHDEYMIYDSRTAREFLLSIGLSVEDIEELQSYLNQLNEENDVSFWRQEAYDWEQDSIREFELRSGLISTIQNLADELASGKGGTKAQYAQHLRDACDFWE